jgi:hypothetical protein
MHNTIYVTDTRNIPSLPSWEQAGLEKRHEFNVIHTNSNFCFPVSWFFYETLHKTMMQIKTILEHHAYKAQSAIIWLC